MTRPTILIADDHKMFAQGLAGLLEDEFDLVASVENGQALIDEALRLKPDLIIVDISMPVLNGLDAVRRLSQNHTGSKVVFLTMHADTRLLREAFQCGGVGYVLKQSAGEELLFALRQVMSGQNYISPSIEKEMKAEALTAPDEKQHFNLTPRQREVLQLLCSGYTMKEIANQLNISTRTAETYKYQIMEGLGVETTAELIQYAVKIGLCGT
ncbi:MAG TPA: response regulator transcription factor [Pyrinomonadaceae bacterium]|nr:response regulator transcription factor [Pyrinomonadaceae bacterium]